MTEMDKGPLKSAYLELIQLSFLCIVFPTSEPEIQRAIYNPVGSDLSASSVYWEECVQYRLPWLDSFPLPMSFVLDW